MKGQYSFVFSNMKDKVNIKSVTLAIHPGKEEEEPEKDFRENNADVKDMA